MGLFILARLLLVEICQFCEKQEQVCLAPEVIGLGQLSVFQEMINVFCDQFRRGSRKHPVLTGKTALGCQGTGADPLKTDPGVSPGICFIRTVGNRFIWINEEHLSRRQGPGLSVSRIESGALQYEMNDKFFSGSGTDMTGQTVFPACVDQTDIKRGFFEIFETAEGGTVGVFYIGHWYSPHFFEINRNRFSFC